MNRKSYGSLRTLYALFLLPVLLCSGCGGGGGSSGSGGSEAPTGILSLEWDAPTVKQNGTPLADLAGFKLYYGPSSGSYDRSVDVGNTTAYSLTGLNKGQVYYVVVTAYNTARTESAYSNEFTGAAE